MQYLYSPAQGPEETGGHETRRNRVNRRVWFDYRQSYHSGVALHVQPREAPSGHKAARIDRRECTGLKRETVKQQTFCTGSLACPGHSRGDAFAPHRRNRIPKAITGL